MEFEWKDDDDDVGESDEEEFEVGKMIVEEDVDVEDDFGYVMFFVKYFCFVEECGGIMVFLFFGELDV